MSQTTVAQHCSAPTDRHPGAGRAATAQRSGSLHRPLHAIRREPVRADDAQTELEKYKLALRRFLPVQGGSSALPWRGLWYCVGCRQTVPGQLVYDAAQDAVWLETECPNCGPGRERHQDVLFVRQQPGGSRPHQPQRTHSGCPIRPVVTDLPKTVETLCPECRAIILGRYYVADGAVWIEKTCPEHGYFSDKINSDVTLYLRGTRAGWQDERGVFEPQVRGAVACPSDCGLCARHHSASCLAQIDLTNRCNLRCPICFANAAASGYVAEPDYEMVVEMLLTLRQQRPYPATAIQFTGGEPTLHPDFLRIISTAGRLGFTHIQIATNGLRLADRDFARRAAEAGLHTLYLQFDGLDDGIYRRTRGRPLLEQKLACIENCREFEIKVCLVPTIVNNCNRDQVGPIFHFAVDNADVISAISYQPVAFTGRISPQQRRQMRYTLGDLARDLSAASGADPYRDFFPLSVIAPLSRIMQTLDGKPKIRPSCHSDCAFGTYFFVTPDKQAVPIPRLFDIERLFGSFNELALKIARQRPDGRANWRDRLALLAAFVGSYNWRQFDRRISPLTFMHTLRGMTNKRYGRGAAGRRTFRTLMAAGMHFMDAYNYDVERVKRCVILYSTPDGVYPFCTINGGPEYRPYIERMIARS